LILRRKTHTKTLCITPYSSSLLGKTVENLAFQKQKITHLHYFIYTKSAAFNSSKILGRNYAYFLKDSIKRPNFFIFKVSPVCEKIYLKLPLRAKSCRYRTEGLRRELSRTIILFFSFIALKVIIRTKINCLELLL